MSSDILKVVLYTGLYALLNMFGASMIKKQLIGVKLDSVKQLFDILINPLIIVAFALIFLSALVMMKALSIHRFSLVIPIATGLNFLITVLVGVLYFNDQLSTLQYAGIIAIFVGVLLIAFASN